MSFRATDEGVSGTQFIPAETPEGIAAEGPALGVAGEQLTQWTGEGCRQAARRPPGR